MISLILKDLSVRLGEKKILDGINATFYGGEIGSVIGQNGSGKTTLLKAIAGICAHQGNVCVLDGVNELPNKVVRYMPQLSSVTSRLTVFEMVLLGLEAELGWRVDQATFDRVDRMLHYTVQLELLIRFDIFLIYREFESSYFSLSLLS